MSGLLHLCLLDALSLDIDIVSWYMIDGFHNLWHTSPWTYLANIIVVYESLNMQSL